MAFTGHHVVAADVDAAWVAEHCPTWALEVPFGPAFVAALGERLGARIGTLDLVLVAEGTSARPARGEPTERDLALRPADADELRAATMDAPNPRSEMRLWRTLDGAGQLLIGRGLAGRWEAAIKVDEVARGRGLGRRLCVAARRLVGSGTHVYAQIAPGNIASLRAALAAGFRPIAAEILFFD